MLKNPQAMGNWNYFEVKDDTASETSAFPATKYRRTKTMYAQTNQLERMFGAWEAMGAKATISKGDWTGLESTIASWINGGKMTDTGFAYGLIDISNDLTTHDVIGTENLRSRCVTYDLDPHDYVTLAKVVSG